MSRLFEPAWLSEAVAAINTPALLALNGLGFVFCLRRLRGGGCLAKLAATGFCIAILCQVGWLVLRYGQEWPLGNRTPTSFADQRPQLIMALYAGLNVASLVSTAFIVAGISIALRERDHA